MNLLKTFVFAFAVGFAVGCSLLLEKLDLEVQPPVPIEEVPNPNTPADDELKNIGEFYLEELEERKQ